MGDLSTANLSEETEDGLNGLAQYLGDSKLVPKCPFCDKAMQRMEGSHPLRAWYCENHGEGDYGVRLEIEDA